MKFVLTGGGTAGHINPALALAEILQECDHEVFFAGTPQGVEARLVGRTSPRRTAFCGFRGFGVAIRRSVPHTLVTSFRLKILRSARKAKASELREVRPDAVVGVGGYVSIPVGMAAEQLNVPVVVHEQDSVMGMANEFLGKKARQAAVLRAMACGVAGKDIADASKLIVTGNPVRSSVLSATREQGREMLGRSARCHDAARFRRQPGRAPHQRRYLVQLKKQLLAIDGLYVVHITGPKEYEATCAELALTDEEVLPGP